MCREPRLRSGIGVSSVRPRRGASLYAAPAPPSSSPSRPLRRARRVPGDRSIPLVRGARRRGPSRRRVAPDRSHRPRRLLHPCSRRLHPRRRHRHRLRLPLRQPGPRPGRAAERATESTSTRAPLDRGNRRNRRASKPPRRDRRQPRKTAPEAPGANASSSAATTVELTNARVWEGPLSRGSCRRVVAGCVTKRVQRSPKGPPLSGLKRNALWFRERRVTVISRKGERCCPARSTSPARPAGGA